MGSGKWAVHDRASGAPNTASVTTSPFLQRRPTGRRFFGAPGMALTRRWLVFVHARETLAHLGDLLTRSGIAFVQFDGGLSGPQKDAAIATFRDNVPVLLSTESGGEGRNIQFCNTLINFDIPWNPMAIEQRIGRIDRIGQEREVFVFNLVSGGTLEDGLLRLLDEKINMFELVVGEVGAILGELDDERNFADLVLDTWLETTAAGAPGALDALGER